MGKLLIVESPTKAKKISSILGSGWTVKASIGHIRDLPTHEMGVSLDDFSIQYVYRPGKNGKSGGREVVKQLREEARRASSVYLGTDIDREGESIAWHLAQELNLSNPLRVGFNEITKSAIEKALASPEDINEDRVRAQEARRVLDRLVGYRVSPKLSDMVGQPLSAGRVQTPALRLIVEREREIRSFVSREHYGVVLTFDGGWRAEWNFKPFLTGEDKIWTDRAIADAVAQIRDVVVLECTPSEEKRSPSPAFTTSTVQQAASVKLKMRPQQTMQVAQKLFESGHITYHRTDDPNLSEEGIKAIREFATEHGLPLPPQPRRWKAKSGAQEAHEGIRPTHIEVENAGDSDEEKALYRLIRQQALASQLADALYAARTIVLRARSAAIGSQLPEFTGKGRVLTSPGWLAITGGDTTKEDEDEEPTNPIPQIEAGTPLTACAGETKVKNTQPPGAYTEASLIKELERREIGRPSTYASIMATLDKRNYVELDNKRKLHPTKIGEVVVDALVGRFAFADLGFTRAMEAELDKIAVGQRRYIDLVRSTNIVLDQELAKLGTVSVARIERDGPKCPTCKSGILVKRKGKYGSFWSCDAFRTTGCKAAFPDKRGKPDFTPRTAAQPDENAPTCPTCGKGKLIKRESKNGPFYGCTEYKNGCRAAFKSLPQGEVA